MEKVAIIIVGYNSVKFLPRLFSSLKDFPPQNVIADIIFIDNNSIDGSASWVKENNPTTIVLEQKENLGFAGGNNLGIEYALLRGYDYVLLLNPDTAVASGYLDKLILTLKNNPLAAAVQPKIMLYPETELLNCFGCVIHYLGFGYTWGNREKAQELLENVTLKRVNYCSGAACLIRTSVLQKAGLFDPQLFIYHEDLDLGWRFLLAGYENLATTESVIFHQYEFSRSIKKFYFMERNRFIVMLKNYKVGTLILIFPALLIMEIGLLLFAIKGGFLLEKLKAYFYFLKPGNWQKILRARKIVQTSRKISDREAIKNFSGIILHQETDNILLRLIANPLLNLYWAFIKKIIIW